MRSSEKDLMLLDGYIKGRLDVDVTSEFEMRLVHERDLKADLEDLKELHQGMRVKALLEKLEMMKGWENDMVGEVSIAKILFQ
ncbi:MAG: hypothetical protein IPN86_00845 [Saprospiraceae bacterium]|nr:hypothetical protein [Saprospiraceae bacterium]